MSQPSKPTVAYFKAVAKVLRLQRALSRSSGSKSKGAVPAPCTSSIPTFQHTNGRRLSYHHHHNHLSNIYLDQNHQRYRNEQYDTALFALQGRRSENTCRPIYIDQHSSTSLSHRPASKDITLHPTASPSASKINRKSGPPSVFPIITMYHTQSTHSSSESSLARSHSMPTQRRRRISHLSTIIPQSQHRDNNAKSSSEAGEVDSQVLEKIPGQIGYSFSSVPPTVTYATNQEETVVAPAVKTFPSLRPSASRTSSSSRDGSMHSTTMPLIDSNMSIESHLSESSLLSATLSASGMPTIDDMMDILDQNIAADSQAKLVENAHVGLPHVLVVDRQLIAEPCSARIETWVGQGFQT